MMMLVSVTQIKQKPPIWLLLLLLFALGRILCLHLCFHFYTNALLHADIIA